MALSFRGQPKLQSLVYISLHVYSRFLFRTIGICSEANSTVLTRCCVITLHDTSLTKLCLCSPPLNTHAGRLTRVLCVCTNLLALFQWMWNGAKRSLTQWSWTQRNHRWSSRLSSSPWREFSRTDRRSWWREALWRYSIKPSGACEGKMLSCTVHFLSREFLVFTNLITFWSDQQQQMSPLSSMAPFSQSLSHTN